MAIRGDLLRVRLRSLKPCAPDELEEIIETLVKGLRAVEATFSERRFESNLPSGATSPHEAFLQGAELQHEAHAAAAREALLRTGFL